MPVTGDRSKALPSYDEIEADRVEIAVGLLEAKHRKAMGPALHFYLYLLHRKRFRSPFVASGRVLPLAVLAWVEGTTERGIRRWLSRLRRHGYIETTIVRTGRRHGSGIKIRILKAKEWHRGVRRTFRDGVRTKVS